MADLDAEYRGILKREWTARKAKNSRFSLRSYARLLGIDASFLSKLLTGKLLLSLDVADKITKKLRLTPADRIIFLKSAAAEQSCHALYLIDPTLTDCDPNLDSLNRTPSKKSRSKISIR